MAGGGRQGARQVWVSRGRGCSHGWEALAGAEACRRASAASECHSVTLERLLVEVMAGNMILPKMVILEHSELLN